jgi:hypothetical protein
MQVKDGDIDIVEQLRIILDSIAAGKENNDLLLEVLLQEGEQQQEANVAVNDDIALRCKV